MDESRSGHSRPIGSLMSETLPSLSARAERPNGSSEKARAAVTTTSAKGTSLPTTTRHGGHGSATPTTSLPAIVARTDLRDRLHRNPAQFLRPSLRSAVAATWADGDTGNGWDGHVSRYEITRPLSDEEHAQALAFVDEALAPANEDFVLAELARLRALTVSRDIGQDLTLVLSAYADELMRYPADAILEVLRAWPKSNRFWPGMAELEEHLGSLVAPRKALRDALQRGYRAPKYSPDWTPPPTEEQKREVIELLERHGIRLDERGRVRPREREPIALADIEQAERELPDVRDMWIRRLLADEPTAGAA